MKRLRRCSMSSHECVCEGFEKCSTQKRQGTLTTRCLVPKIEPIAHRRTRRMKIRDRGSYLRTASPAATDYGRTVNSWRRLCWQLNPGKAEAGIARTSAINATLRLRTRTAGAESIKGDSRIVSEIIFSDTDHSPDRTGSDGPKRVFNPLLSTHVQGRAVQP